MKIQKCLFDSVFEGALSMYLANIFILPLVIFFLVLFLKVKVRESVLIMMGLQWNLQESLA